jgi:pimeloyl-ACP methyl ester carboxylesterase
VTENAELDRHVRHVRSKHPKALPLSVPHTWPGSVLEKLKLIAPRTDLPAHGASAADAFDRVLPALPGSGYSAKPTTTGWDPVRIARAWVALMRRLGYPHLVAQGGDWGAIVTEVMAAPAPPELLGTHFTMPGPVPPDVAKALQAGEPPPSGLSTDESRAYEQLALTSKLCSWARVGRLRAFAAGCSGNPCQDGLGEAKGCLIPAFE